ncbi:MAG: hypothetical protein D6815_00910 [Candidatus Dadabacteria bacterium]|nr:MAG: hypothetical protein D6815_00910 [Candidatus Dadabacteria bacterium]
MSSAQALDFAPKVVISIASGSGTTICNTDCTICTVESGECLNVVQNQLIMCRPIGDAIPITGCHWQLFLDGGAPGINLTNQIRALDIAPNGNLVLVSLNDENLPGVGTLTKKDIGLFVPDDVTLPYAAGLPYTSGTFAMYLNGDLTQQEETTKPWDALELLLQGGCEDNLRIDPGVQYTCPVIGSLTQGSGSAGLGGLHFRNEDLLRCTPTGFGPSGTIEACQYSLFLDASNINADTYGEGQGIGTDIEAIDLLSFDRSSMFGQMVFKKGSGNPPGFPAHDPKFDLLLYEGTFGAGLCDPSGTPCAGDEDCPDGETCDTGSCSLDGLPCASELDCSGSGNTCLITRYPAGTVTKLFDGVAVGLSGFSQKIEAFAIVPDRDNDDILDGLDNCTNPGGQQNLTIKPALTLKKINTDPDPNNEVLVLKGEFLLAPGDDFANLDLVATGARVVIESVGGSTLSDTSVPAGAFDGTSGWKVNGALTKYTFVDKQRPASNNGILKIVVQDRSKKAPRQVKIKVKAKDGSYPVTAADVPVRAVVIIGSSLGGQCTETAFAAADCKFNGKQNTLKCKQ